MASFFPLVLLHMSLIQLIMNIQQTHAWKHVDPTKGFISQPLNESNLVIQRPFDVPEDQRYSFVHGVHKLWVYSKDKPHSLISQTSPRTEIRIHVVLLYRSSGGWPIDPTFGFVELPLNTANIHIQKPYNLPVTKRYNYKDGVHKLWVYSSDMPLSSHSPTKPRSEILIRGYDYSSGVWQFEGYGYVPRGTSGVCIMQVFGSSPPHATTLMLRVYNGSLFYYRDPVLVPNIYDRWFRVNVIHDVDHNKVKVYIDGILKFKARGRGGTSHYFKCGVYAQTDDSKYMESRWKGIKVFKKCD